MKITKLKLMINPRILKARIIRGINPFYGYSALLAKKYGGNIRTIIDIGANVGEYSLACREVFPDAKIFSFEPNPRAFEKLEKEDFLVSYNCALTNKNGKVNFNFDEEWDSTSSLLDYGRGNKRFGVKLKKIKLEGRRFDSLHIEIKKPCFAKIETQGTEAKVLEGFGDKLKKVDVLNVIFNFIDNYEGQSKLSEIAKLTEEAGFKKFIQVWINEKKGCEFYFFR